MESLVHSSLRFSSFLALLLLSFFSLSDLFGVGKKLIQQVADYRDASMIILPEKTAVS